MIIKFDNKDENLSLDEIIMGLVKGVKERNENINSLEKEISPYANENELYKIVKNLIEENDDYARKILKNSSNIIYQQDFVITDKFQYMYNIENFNNDAEYLNFFESSKIMLVCKDYMLHNCNFDFYTDVFINGIKVDRNKYFERASYEVKPFETSCRRIFINADLVQNNDVISIVVKRCVKADKFYKFFKVTNKTNKDKPFKFSTNDIGYFGDDLSNVLLYKLSTNCKDFKLVDTTSIDRNNHIYLQPDETVDDEFYLNLKDEDIQSDCIGFLIINKNKNVEIDYINKNDLSESEYLKFESTNSYRLDLYTNRFTANGKRLPIPVSDINEIEIFVDGFRLIPNIDYRTNVGIENDNESQYIQFNGILKPNSVITVRNKNFNSKLNFFKNVDLTLANDLLEITDSNKETIKDALNLNSEEELKNVCYETNNKLLLKEFKEYIDTMKENNPEINDDFLEENRVKYDDNSEIKQDEYSYGIIDLCSDIIPISEDYIEAYIGRIRVPLLNKKSIINTYLKIDDQHTTLHNANIYSEIYSSNFNDQFIREKDDKKKNIYSQLNSLGKTSLQNSWLFNNEEDKLNSNKNGDNDPFLGYINSITLSTNQQRIKIGKQPKFQVIGTFTINDSQCSVDITKYSNIYIVNEENEAFLLTSGYNLDTSKAGEIRLFAQFISQNNKKLSTSETLVIEVEERSVNRLVIYTKSNIYKVGDDLKNTVKVFAIFDDNVVKDVTNYVDLKCDEKITESGSYFIKASYSYATNSDTKLYAEKTIFASDNIERYITNLIMIPSSKLTEDRRIQTSFLFYATYDNNMTQKLNNESIELFIIDKDNTENKIYFDYDESNDKYYYYGFKNNTDYKLRVKIHTTNDINSELIKFDSNNLEEESLRYTDYLDINFNVLKDPISSNTKYLILSDTDNTVVSLSSKYRIPEKAFYYRIRSANSNMYLTSGSVSIGSSAIISDTLEAKSYVVIEFLDEEMNSICEDILYVTKDSYNDAIIINSVLNEFNMDNDNNIELSGFKLDIELENNLDNIIFSEDEVYKANLFYINENSSGIGHSKEIIATIPKLSTSNGNLIIGEYQNSIIFNDFTISNKDSSNVYKIMEFLNNHQSELLNEMKLYVEIEGIDDKVILCNKPIINYSLFNKNNIDFSVFIKNIIASDGSNKKEFILEAISGNYNISKVYRFTEKYNGFNTSDNNYINIPLYSTSSKSLFVDSSYSGLNRYVFKLINKLNSNEVLYKIADIEVREENYYCYIYSINNNAINISSLIEKG